MGNTYNRVYIWCCKYGENRYYERCVNKYWCPSKHTGLLNSCLGKFHLHPNLVVPLISARVPLISTRVSAHCQAILLTINQQLIAWCWTSYKPLPESVINHFIHAYIHICITGLQRVKTLTHTIDNKQSSKKSPHGCHTIVHEHGSYSLIFIQIKFKDFSRNF